MKPFLKLFGVEMGNIISPLVTAQYNNPTDLCSIIKEFFKTPLKDPRETFTETTENDVDMAALYDEEEGETVNSGKELDVITAFSAFCVSTPTIPLMQLIPVQMMKGMILILTQFI